VRVVSYIVVYCTSFIYITHSLTHLPSTPTNTMPVQKRNEKGMTGYNALWDKQSAKDTADHVKSRVDNYTDLVNGMSSTLRVKSTSTNI
jgi:hypothetical protein